MSILKEKNSTGFRGGLIHFLYSSYTILTQFLLYSSYTVLIQVISSYHKRKVKVSFGPKSSKKNRNRLLNPSAKIRTELKSS